jgi:hypothetical protein
MTKNQTQYVPVVAQNSADADLLIRLGIVLALRERAGWQVVRLGVRNGVVRLAGRVPTYDDRRLIACVTRHVAGVRRVDDELTVADLSNRQSSTDGRTRSNGDGSATNAATWRAAFNHLPAVQESLEDILAGQTRSAQPDLASNN